MNIKLGFSEYGTFSYAKSELYTCPHEMHRTKVSGSGFIALASSLLFGQATVASGCVSGSMNGTAT